MRPVLALLCVCLACVQPTNLPRMTPQTRESVGAEADSLTSAERARIVEAISSFRQMVFSTDTTIRLEGCSVALAVGPEYRALIRSDVRKRISEPTTACGNAPDFTGYTRRLVLHSIKGGRGEATARVSYLGGGAYTHDEDYKLRRASSRVGGPWVAMEIRVFGAMHID
jgi:hypothetical protein